MMDTITKDIGGCMDIRRVVFVDKHKSKIERSFIEIEHSQQCIVEHEYTLISPGTEGALFGGTHIGFSDPDITWARYPVYPGYAAAGRVCKRGKESTLSEGTRVLYYGPHASHGILDPSKMVWAEIPEEADPKPFLLIRFAQIAYSALAALHRPPERVLVYGAGMVGNLCAQQMQHILGVEEVYITDLSGSRLAIARQCGLKTVSAGEETLSSFDTIIEATGAPLVLNEGLKRLKKGGQLILLGSSRGTAELNVYKLLHRPLTSLIGAHETILPVKAGEKELVPLYPPVPWKTQQDVADALSGLVAAGTLVTAPFVQRLIPPEAVQEAFMNLQQNPDDYLGICLEWNRNGTN
jgi:2-desacetyl-2-hydroxyethyl bacteriochlorophyllide A dehydrogenase